MKKIILLNPQILIFNLLPLSLFIRLDSVTANLRHGDIIGASLEMLNLLFGAHWHKYQNHLQSPDVPANLKWFGSLVFSSLISLMMLITIG